MIAGPVVGFGPTVPLQAARLPLPLHSTLSLDPRIPAIEGHSST